jgi:hypothetical protein
MQKHLLRSRKIQQDTVNSRMASWSLQWEPIYVLHSSQEKLFLGITGQGDDATHQWSCCTFLGCTLSTQTPLPRDTTKYVRTAFIDQGCRLLFSSWPEQLAHLWSRSRSRRDTGRMRLRKEGLRGPEKDKYGQLLSTLYRSSRM